MSKEGLGVKAKNTFGNCMDRRGVDAVTGTGGTEADFLLDKRFAV
jgi:hypothetical protein